MGVKTTVFTEGTNLRSDRPILKIGFLHGFMLFDNNSIRKGAAMSLFLYFMEILAAAALTARLWAMSKFSHSSVKERVLTTCCRVVNHLLPMYTTYGIIAETDGEIDCFVRPSTMSSLDFTNALWLKTVICLDVND